ncbi:hypothetical protein ADUPG1_011316, partial [Aduncisulcus paluster]
MLKQIVSAYVGQNVFEAFLVYAKEVKCDCDSDCSEGELAVTLDQISRYALEWKRLVKKHVGSKWTEIQRKRAATAFIRGLRPLSFSEKVMEDVDDWRRYGVTQNSDDPTKPVINSDDVKGVSDYAIALVQEARFHRMRGQSSVGQVLAEVSSHERRSSTSVSGLFVDLRVFIASNAFYSSAGLSTTIKLISDDRWKLYAESLKERDLLGEQRELQLYRKEIVSEVTFAESEGHKPGECDKHEKPFNMKKDILISNWYPGIPARDVVYEKFVSDFTYQFDRDSVKKQVEQLQKKVGTKTAKCLFDTGANVSLISEEWIARSGYRVDGDDSKVIAARRANRFDGALVKADSPLTFTVFGGGKFSVTHYIVLKTCACRGSGNKYNQLTTSCGYVTYWVTPWLKNDVPLLIGRDGMSAMKIKLGIVDVRGYRERGVQNSEIKSVLRRLVDCVKPNRE